MVEQVDAASFDARSATGVVVVEFFGKRCEPCKKLAPVFEEVAKEFSGRASFLKADVEDVPDQVVRYGVTSVPTVVLLKDGAASDVIQGFVPRFKLSQRVSEALG